MKVFDIHAHIAADDLTMDKYVTSMDKHDVEAVLCHGVPDQDYGYSRTNQHILDAMKRHPGRIYGSPHIDLRLPLQQCIDEIDRSADAGCVSIKLFPNLGFDPNDEAFEPMWRKVEERGLACLSHCGWLLLNSRNPGMRIHSLTATPFHFEVPARRHAGIRFIFAHFGGATTYLETVVLLLRLPNCYADICPGWGTWVWDQRLPGLEAVPMHKLLFGTDTAGERYGERIQHWNRMLTSYGKNEAQIEDFFYHNARRLLKLEPPAAQA